MEIPAEFVERLTIWNKSAYTYYVIGYFTLAVGILSGLAVTAFTEHLGTQKTRLLGFIAAASTAILAGFSPIEIGHNFRSAWRVLDQASLEYKFAKPEERDIKTLITAIEKGEKIIGTLDPGKTPVSPIK